MNRPALSFGLTVTSIIKKKLLQSSKTCKTNFKVYYCFQMVHYICFAKVKTTNCKIIDEVKVYFVSILTLKKHF